MLATASSPQHAALKTERETGRVASSISAPSVKSRRTNWVASAAKRVGFNRVSEGMPRSRKAGSVINGITPADEVSDNPARC